MKLLKSKKGLIVGTSVVTGIFLFLLIILPIMGFGAGMLSSKYFLFLVGAIILLKLFK